MLTYKYDHIKTHQEVLGTTIIGGTIPKPIDAPESFRLLVRIFSYGTELFPCIPEELPGS